MNGSMQKINAKPFEAIWNIWVYTAYYNYWWKWFEIGIKIVICIGQARLASLPIKDSRVGNQQRALNDDNALDIDITILCNVNHSASLCSIVDYQAYEASVPLHSAMFPYF